MASLTAWALTTGEAGMRTQARGLAQAVADVVVEKTISGFATWPWTPLPLGRELHAPWPDLVVSCGRRSVSAALAVRKASGGRALAVCIQDPRGRAAEFDLVIAMGHDRIAASDSIIKVPTALHDLTPEALARDGAAWARRFARLGHPLTGVVVGGDLKGRPFTLADGRRLIEGLKHIMAASGCGLAITPSRRTPAGVRVQLSEAFVGNPRVFIWDLTDDNPYRAILALSDRLVVTSDSVSMVSEALSAPHPVEILDLGFRRHAAFIQGLVDRGLARRFTGDPTPPAAIGLINATELAAQAVRALLQARTGVSG